MRMSKGTVYSIYFPNVSEDVVTAQRKCVELFLPADWTFLQVAHTPKLGDAFPHAHAMEKCVASNINDLTAFLDIDCIPLSDKAFPFLEKHVIANNNQGLVGITQRSNHIRNDRHIYVGPSCMAFSKIYYKELGSPSFIETERGDVGEELTYRWTEKSGFLARAGINPHKYSSNIGFIWPFACVQPMWDLDFGWKFGFGTTYGAAGFGPLFYHQFNIRVPEMHQAFVSKCKEVLTQNERILA